MALYDFSFLIFYPMISLVWFSCAESNCTNMDAQFYFQHLIRKLGSEPYIGQRALLFVSQRISVLAESLLFTDPFDIVFPYMHGCMFIM